MSKLRFKSIEEAYTHKPVQVRLPNERPEKYYGELVFDRRKMFQYLERPVYEQLCRAIEDHTPISMNIADKVAEGMRRWAIENGARHYTHWFHPLTGGTAEKHDSFIDHDGKGGVIEKFSGKILVQQEPDASSFPSGGIRNTFEARGYSAWDISSPAFIVDGTLCIPTIFISYTGESLDYKTPLLRSLNAIDKAATRVARWFDPNVKHVTNFLGWEQEYFLIDEAIFSARPDLTLTGRTLMGHESAKNQQLDDHYFGAIPGRVEAFMLDLEIESHRLGIPVKTRHNEVAPNQFELAPVYEECNLANDHNLLIMKLMDEVARRHNFRVLLHEKPFAGINGSGKHNNWSLGTDTGTQLFSPGPDADSNLQFVTLVAAVMDAVCRHNALLKASIISATNAHRLGANEAPPAIISMFLGDHLTKLLDAIEAGDHRVFEVKAQKDKVDLDVFQIPQIMLDNTDRNRTSPFAFTGNRFEFRAVGSSANNAAALIALNSAVAESLINLSTAVDERVNNGDDRRQAIIAEVSKLVKNSRHIQFDGNGYSEEWKIEAANRGLDTETSAPLMFDAYLSPTSINMFKSTGVLSQNELEARNEVKWETYTKKIQIESRVLGDLSLNHIMPTAIRYQNILLDNVAKIQSVYGSEKGSMIAERDMKAIEAISNHLTSVSDGVEKMTQARKIANRIESQRQKAIAYHDTVVPLMEQIRRHIDKLELMVDNEMWPLPKYREMLFIR